MYFSFGSVGNAFNPMHILEGAGNHADFELWNANLSLHSKVLQSFYYHPRQGSILQGFETTQLPGLLSSNELR